MRALTRTRLVIASLAALAVFWVWAYALVRPVPSEDGVSYLWMAQQFAAGEWGAALSMVFPPGYPLLVAPLVSCGMAVEPAADAVNAIAFALCLWPLAWIARHLSPGIKDVPEYTCVLFMTGSLLLRVAAEVYSEPLFLLVMAWGTVAGLCGRYWLLGALAGVAFWIRPEGLLLPAAFFLAAPRQAWPAALPAMLGVVLLATLRWSAGRGFDPLPILGFHETRDDLEQRGQFLANLLEVYGAWFEAYGPLGALLFAWALPPARRVLPNAPALWWQIALQVVVVCTFVVRRRFLLSCAVPTIALAGAVLGRLPAAWRHVLMLALALYGIFGAALGRMDADRYAERDLGTWIAAWLEPGQRVTGDLTRVLWFAGERPLPPRHFDTRQLQAMAMADGVRYFVFSSNSKRQSAGEIEAVLASDFDRVVIPEPVGSRCRERGIVLLQRR